MEKQSATSVDEIEARAQAGTHATARRAVLLLDMENFYHSRKDVARETNPGKGYHLEDLNGDLKVLKDWVGLTLGGTRLTIARGYADYRALSRVCVQRADEPNDARGSSPYRFMHWLARRTPLTSA